MNSMDAPSAQPFYVARGLRRQASELGILADAELTLCGGGCDDVRTAQPLTLWRAS